MAKHFGRTSLAKILPNLPAVSRDRLQSVLDSGWNCAFYLGVHQKKMMLCLVGRHRSQEHVVVAADSETLVRQFYMQITTGNGSGWREQHERGRQTP